MMFEVFPEGEVGIQIGLENAGIPEVKQGF